MSLLAADPNCDRWIFCCRFLYTTAPAPTMHAPAMTPKATPSFCPPLIPPDDSLLSKSAALGSVLLLTSAAGGGVGDGGGDGDGDGELCGGGAGECGVGARSEGGGAGGEENEGEGEGAEDGEGESWSAGGDGGREGGCAGEWSERAGRVRRRRREKTRMNGEIEAMDEIWEVEGEWNSDGLELMREKER